MINELRYKGRTYKRTKRYRHNVVNMRQGYVLRPKVEYKLVRR
jgi:hypothetical protein